MKKTFFSYKDPSARVVKQGGVYLRFIHDSYQAEFKHLMSCGLYDTLVSQGLMVRHVEIPNEKLPSRYFVEILPEQIPFHVLPFEWTFNDWKEALSVFLKINQIALSHGMILKDATPYNFARIEGEMRMFDTSSFQFFEEKSSWIAYRQFCQEMLGPLALMKFLGSAWSRLSQSYLRGMPLDFISRQLPLASYFNLPCLFHLHLHSRFQAKSGQAVEVKNFRGFTNEGLQLLLRSLEKKIGSWQAKTSTISLWNHYYEEDLESEFYLANKQELISAWLKARNPKRVTDLGANNGYFSLLASQFAEQVLAIEYSLDCVEGLQAEIREKGIKNVTTCVADLSQLSPDLGNGFQEFANLGTRGHADMVMALALIHHLCLSFSFSFDQVIGLCKQFTTDYLIIEYVPKEDTQAMTLLHTLEDHFQDYTESNFEKALIKSFTILEKVPILQTKRILYLAQIGHERTK